MEKPIAAIEFGSKKLKLVVGYEIQGQVYVICTYVQPYGRCINGNDFLDMQKISECVKQVSKYQDDAMRIKVSISEALLTLPPYGLQIFDTKQSMAVISQEKKVGPNDIFNLYSMIRNGTSKMSNVLVDTVPELFQLDNGNTYKTAPFDEPGTFLTVVAKVHTLPKNIIDDYNKALSNGGVKCKRPFVAPYAAMQLLSTYPEVPNDYLLVDIGSNITTVSLVGGKQLFSSCFFNWGGDAITERIREAFNVNEVDAENCKILYGLSDRPMKFKVPVCKTTDLEGNQIEHSADELTNIIKGEVDNFLTQLQEAINNLLIEYDQSYKSLPLVLVGGGSRLSGLVDYMKPKVFNSNVMAVLPKSLGARDATFTNCLGMIIANSKNPTVYDSSHPQIVQLTRNPRDE